MNLEKEKEKESYLLVVNRKYINDNEKKEVYLSKIQKSFLSLGFIEEKELPIFKDMRVSSYCEENENSEWYGKDILIIEGNYINTNNNNYYNLRIIIQDNFPFEYEYIETKDISSLNKEVCIKGQESKEEISEILSSVQEIGGFDK